MNKKLTNNTLIRQILVRLKRSIAFKLLIIGFFILLTFSIAIYYFERKAIEYHIENGKHIEIPEKSSNIRTFKDSLWWAFVTSTTVGYGDYYPVSNGGRLTGIILMFFGISLVGIITGNIASLLVDRQLKEDKGLNDLTIKNHFIICGWKREMAEVLSEIMEKNKSFLASEIVLINTVDPQEVENLRSDNRFRHINFIHGDYIDERVLARANLSKAKKALVLADRNIKGSVQEVDSKTVMAIITIKSISKTIYTAAELLDSKFERYLRFSNCDEIILSSDYNRSLIANASAGSGISHVISELLSVDSSVSINTMSIPAKFIGKKFDELFEFYLKKNRTILIGVLENTGNFLSRKKEALFEAQKTPDISKLVDNLKMVKTLVANKPVLNPYADYILKKNSKAIIIEGNNYK